MKDVSASTGRGSGSRVFGLTFARETRAELVEAVLAPSDPQSDARLVVTANLDHIVTLSNSAPFRAAYDAAWKITADGTPVYLYANAVGAGLKERVTGSDLFATLVDRWDSARHRLFMLASNEVTASKMIALMATRGFGPSRLEIVVPPFGFEADEAYGDALAARIAAFAPTHVVFGVGAPKSEIWAHRNAHRWPGTVVLCVGASIEFVTGDKTRAPAILQRLGAEWLWRVGSEPRRLFRRYFVRSFGFIHAVVIDQRNGGARR